MANSKSEIITNRVAGTRNDIHLDGGRTRTKTCVVTTAAADAAGHIYRLCDLPATAIISSITRVGEADAGMTTVNMGVYNRSETDTDPTAIDDDCLVSGSNLSGATGIPTQLGAGANTLNGKPLWEVAGQSEAPTPGTMYEICMDPGGNPAGTARNVITITYVAGD